MYNSSYSRAKFGPEVRSLKKSKGKSCGYYVKVVFILSSLIQSLIIVSLVLFVIYGQPEKSAVEKRELELVFNKLSVKNMELRKEKTGLETQLKARAEEKAALEKEMTKQKADANKTVDEWKRKYVSLFYLPCELTTLKARSARQDAMINLLTSNFTQTVRTLRDERDNALRDRAQFYEDVIKLRGDNTICKEQLITYTRKCKEDFAKSLEGITAVTREFLKRINNLFPNQMTFHLTCKSQLEQMEKIKSSCTNLSRDVENKFQMYLDNVGRLVSEIQGNSSRLEVENRHLLSNFQECQRRRSEFADQTAKQFDLLQRSHDDKVNNIWMDAHCGWEAGANKELVKS
uniref:Plasmalemma vesicle associated protein b n=1 Tax=Amphilophus citrinellus TaxID=61819 RepID=A0A3Q0S227_AMPCI